MEQTEYTGDETYDQTEYTGDGTSLLYSTDDDDTWQDENENYGDENDAGDTLEDDCTDFDCTKWNDPCLITPLSTLKESNTFNYVRRKNPKNLHHRAVKKPPALSTAALKSPGLLSTARNTPANVSAARNTPANVSAARNTPALHTAARNTPALHTAARNIPAL
eukprot:6171491-Ditylum_brightwellii.AAC.1